MLQFILNLALQNGLKGLGAYLIAHGWATQSQSTAIIGGITAAAGVLWDAYQKHQHAVLTGAIAPTLPNAGAKMGLLAILLLPACLLTGCALPKDIAHVYHISGDGTSLGLTQNPTTQAYELGLKRIHTTLTIVPIVFQTNASGGIACVVPDAVISDEINGRNSVFGGAGGTITLATGTNAVQTLLGGSHVPINEGSGTNIPK